MFEWPARCATCGEVLEDWADAGLYDGAWVHKRCWSEMNRSAQGKRRAVSALRSPVDRSSQLELPMMISLLLFHFGLAAAMAGWFLLTQTDQSREAGMILLVVGLVAP
jgi:hypothetical protein